LYEKTSPKLHRCAEHQVAFARVDNAKRNRKAWRHGRTSKRWQQIRAAVLARDGRCLECGSTADLTVHLDPALEGNHLAAGPENCATLCRRCHGRLDGARSHS